jgi:methionine sulfoxide reductase heme-binding subunit
MKWKSMFGKISKYKALFLIIIVLGSFGLFNIVNAQETIPQPTFAKDSDLDGLTDESELKKYKTDPNNPDTDGDGVLDYQEVVDGSDPLNAKSNSIEHARARTSFLPEEGIATFWYIGRISGVAAFIMFTLVVVFGLLMTSKFLLKFPFMSAPGALETHSFNATFVAFTLVIVHISSFLFDDVLQLTIQEALIPFAVQRPNLRSGIGLELTLPIALGIFAFYVMLILLITSKLKNKLISSKNWRKVHYLSFLFYILFMVHAILAGTDSTQWWMITIYSVSGVTVTALIILRIFGKKYFINSAREKAKANRNSELNAQASANS